MNQPMFFSRYLAAVFALFVISGALLPRYYGIPYPKPPGSQNQFTPNIQKGGINAISEKQPQAILIGDSVLYTGVEDSVFSESLGLESYSIAVPGSGSAIWYLILKNIVIGAEHHPKYVIIPFRDTLLTIPSFRTTGYYFSVVDEYAGSNETLLVKLAYANSMNPLEKMAEEYFPLYGARWQIRERIEQRLRYFPAAFFLYCDQSCNDSAFRAALGQEGADNLNFNNRAAYDAGILYSRSSLDFANSVDKSFLPAMIQLAQENDITLVFVRMKNLEYPVSASETPALREYIRALAEYLSAQENTRFLDLSHEESILPAYFESDGIHFNAEGKIAFSKILAAKLKSITEQ